MKKVVKKRKKNGIKKILSASLIIGMAVSVMLQSAFLVNAELDSAAGSKSTYNQSNPSYHYFYDQLSSESKKIYEAMEEMYESGIFAKSEDYDLSKNGKVTDEQLNTFVNGSSKLLDDYGAARDAFQYDYPDVFYVDFSLLSIRVLKDSDGNLHGYLGAGRSDTYLLRTFTINNIPTAIDQYEKAIEAALKDLPTQAKANETLAETQTFYIHDYLIKNMIYHYENEVTNANCNSRTAYDSLYYGEGVCEAYTRGFKALMDRAGIPTVCVYGVYRPSEQVSEMHIWNYVQIDGKWYGVDITHDDPLIKGSNKKNSGHETRKFCLVGELDLLLHHVPSGIMSSANYEFTYPKLELEALGNISVYTDGDLVVKLKKEDYSADDGEVLQSGTIQVSYKGKNYTQNAKDGYYILSKYGQYYPESDTWYYSDWAYITPQYYDIGGQGMEPTVPDPTMVPENAVGAGYYVNLPLPHIMKAQFAVTTIAPSFKYENGVITGSLYYEGTPALLTAVSEEINNEWGTYVAPPYPTTVSPDMNKNMAIGQTYHIKVVYNDDLKDDGSGDPISIKISQISAFTGSAITGEDYSKAENVIWDSKRTIEFDFTPSKQYADNNSYYNLQITGLIGVNSGKKPVAVNYAFGYASSFCALGVGGFNWKVFGQPQLLDTSDIDISNWNAYDMTTGENIDNIGILEQLTHRLTLVTQEPSPAKSKEMTDMLESEFSDETFLTKKTYNIQLTLCKCMVVQTGQSIRVCVGFPAGYDYSSLDKGVTYKAYHYKVDPDTNMLTGEVEEIRCYVTEYGLIIECDSFSPFTIAAVKSNDTTALNKTVILQSDANGAFYDGDKKLEGHNSFIELTSQNTTKEITVKAKEGYFLNSIIIDNKRIPLDKNSTEHTINLSYNSYKGQTVIVSAEFISAKVYEQDSENGFSNDLTLADHDDSEASPSTGSTSKKPGKPSSQTNPSNNNHGDSSQAASGSDDNSSQESSDSGNLNSSQTASDPGNLNSSQAASDSGNLNPSQAASMPDHSTSKGSETNKTTENKDTGKTEREQKKDSSDNSSGNDSSTNDIASAESENSDSADMTNAADSTEKTSVYETNEEDNQADEKESRAEKTFNLIIIIVIIIGIVAIGVTIIIMRRNKED